MPRYKVEPCDNCGSVEGLARDRTWLVVEAATGHQVAEHTRREDARTEARERNARAS